jgi:hypothetical protein
MRVRKAKGENGERRRESIGKERKGPGTYQRPGMPVPPPSTSLHPLSGTPRTHTHPERLYDQRRRRRRIEEPRMTGSTRSSAPAHPARTPRPQLQPPRYHATTGRQTDAKCERGSVGRAETSCEEAGRSTTTYGMQLSIHYPDCAKLTTFSHCIYSLPAIHS